MVLLSIFRNRRVDNKGKGMKRRDLVIDLGSVSGYALQSDIPTLPFGRRRSCLCVTCIRQRSVPIWIGQLGRFRKVSYVNFCFHPTPSVRTLFSGNTRCRHLFLRAREVSAGAGSSGQSAVFADASAAPSNRTAAPTTS